MNVKNYLKKNGIKLGVIVLVIALVAGAASYLLKGNAGVIQNVSGTVKAPVQRMVSSVAEWLEGIYGYLYEYDQLVAENERLRAELTEAQVQRSGAEIRAVTRRMFILSAEFSALVITPLTNQPFIAENKSRMFVDNRAIHCLLALGQGSEDGVLVYSDGYDYPRLAAYLPGMRDILNARLERAADFIVRQGTEATENGNWGVSFEELEKRTGITIRRGNGLDGMLLDVLTRRREIASAVLTDTGLDIAYHPSFCPRIQGQKPCYFAKLPEEQKTRLFYDAVEVFCELFESEGIYSTLHDGLQMPNEEILARGYLTVEAMLAAGAVIALPENSDISLRDILQYELAEDLSLVHTQGGEPIFLEQEEELTRAERKRFSDVLDARVLETRAGEDGTEIVIDGVKPERLEQFRSVLDAYKPEAQSMKFIQ